MINLRFKVLCLGLLVWGMYGSAQATLMGRLPFTPGGTDYQAYYDSDANLTWLTKANVNGAIQWSDAMNWAQTLRINSVSGWRLPVTQQPDSTCSEQNNDQSFGVNCTGSELGNLFYNVLGGDTDDPIVDHHNANYDLFSNIQSGIYWSATDFAPGAPWVLDFGNGGNQLIDEIANDTEFAWAVHPGDVLAERVFVPAPDALWLMLAGLAGMAAARWRVVQCSRFKSARP